MKKHLVIDMSFFTVSFSRFAPSRKMEKLAQKRVKNGHFPIFLAIHFPGGAEIHFSAIVFPFRAGGPQWGLYQVSGQAIRTPTFRRFARIDSKKKYLFLKHLARFAQIASVFSLICIGIWRDSRPILAANIPFLPKKGFFEARIDLRESAH